ncbi:MAG: ankyrin repeat domain-containing protein [Candidatus Accumulibacter sp.]|jgi:ankyrin repeat protein|nr:ankyrin repeat domain-containing protein [Accumulibacter sp.]
MKNRFSVLSAPVFTILLALLLAPVLSAPALAGAYEEMEEALVRGNAGAVIDLVNRGMDVNTVDTQGNTLLIQSIQRDLPELFAFLLQRKARVNLRNRYGETALSIAAYLGRAEFARRLVDAGAEVNFFGWAPLAYAAYNGHAEIVDYLIGRGADVDAITENGSTALFFAARHGHVETLKALLKHGADPDIVNDNGETAIDWALKGNNTEAANILRAAAAPKSEKP